MNSTEERARMLALLESPPVTPGHLGHTRLRQLAAGEPIDPALAAHAADCPHCRARLDALEADRRAFLARRPTGALLAALEARASAPPWWRRWLPALGGGLLLAGAAALALTWAPAAPAPPEPDGVRLKAAVGLSFHVRTPAGVSDGVPGGTYHPGDAIQLRYNSPAYEHLVVVSIDGRGTVTPFYDADGHSLGIEPGVGKLLDGSVILDDAEGTERIIGCFSPEPLDTATVVAAAEAALADAEGDSAAIDRLAVDCAQAAFTIEKRPR